MNTNPHVGPVVTQETAFNLVPPVPGANALGHIHLLREPGKRLAMLKLAAETAPVTRMRLLHRWLLLVSSPETARELLVESATAFEKSPGTRLLLRPLVKDGLFTSEGALWRSQRRLVSPLFHPSQLFKYATAMNDVTRHAVLGLRDGESLDLARLMTRITMGIVGATLFGVETFESADELGVALTTALKWVDDHLSSNYLSLQLSLIDQLDKLPARAPAFLAQMQRRLLAALQAPILVPTARDPELDAAIQTLDRYMLRMIGERRANPPPEERVDLLTKLLFARDTEPGHELLGAGHNAGSAANGMSDAQVRDEATTLFIAGHETTANALSWAFYLLARHPAARARVQAEADAFGPDGVTHYDAAALAYTTRVFKEALRLYPPLILLGRRSLQPFTLDGVSYPRGVTLFVNPWGIHRSARVWPDPDRFDPDRFLPEQEADRHKGAWIPFGVGPRVCIGNAFALMEGPIVMATLMRNLSFEINPNRDIEPDAFATLRPKGGVPAVVGKRA